MSKDKIRTLQEICEEFSKKGEQDFHIICENNIYCSLGLNRKIECIWQADERDHNGLYPCKKYKQYDQVDLN